MRVGAFYSQNNCEFIVWAPLLKEVSLQIVHPQKNIIRMEKIDDEYWRAKVKNIKPGTRYLINNRPDPASFYQPDGVHKASEVIDHAEFCWEDQGWQGIPKEKMIIYELHVGTFTKQGNFDAIIERLGQLKDLGINTIEIMPVAQFPGKRNWGYDAVYPYAVQNSYGGPNGLKNLVNACHKMGFSVILDVVYNHLGPEGNYLSQFGPYFTKKYKTPWGEAINFDDKFSEGVRNYFIQNVLSWFQNYHIDALRIDAIHGIFDKSKKHILAELAEATAEFSKQKGRKYYLIPESDLNDAANVKTIDQGGHGQDAQWLDDFHHALHTLLTKENFGYYADFGEIEQLKKAYDEGFVYSGQYSKFRGRPHGTSSAGIPPDRFVVFSQNHDQVGNRARGERLSALVSIEALKLAAAAVLLSPYIPLIFMGEEYAEPAPFLYFVDHSDPELIKAVREGRRNEFKMEVPDPGSAETFNHSVLNWDLRNKGRHREMLEVYKEMIKLRKELLPGRPAVRAIKDSSILLLEWKDRTLAMDFKNSRLEWRNKK